MQTNLANVLIILIATELQLLVQFIILHFASFLLCKKKKNTAHRLCFTFAYSVYMSQLKYEIHYFMEYVVIS